MSRGVSGKCRAEFSRSAKTRCAGPESDSEIDAVVCWLLGTERGCALQPWLFLPLLRKLDWKKKKNVPPSLGDRHYRDAIKRAKKIPSFRFPAV